ncbi:MAG: hypothetical protein RL518_2162 [Pseudomonadota bacterium]|jgi:hypothetical protein
MVVVLLYDLDFTQEEEPDGVLPGYNSQRFIGSTEEKYGGHGVNGLLVNLVSLVGTYL